MIARMSDVIGQLLKDNNMPDTPTARAIYKKMLERDDDAQVYQKPWVGLTDEEFDTAINSNITITDSRLRDGVYGVALDIAALLKERNHD